MPKIEGSLEGLFKSGSVEAEESMSSIFLFFEYILIGIAGSNKKGNSKSAPLFWQK
jgi:hypothetical protein